ncbi:hypothetical protein H5410_038004 [Solanum commersonii]|uniref:Cell differentiation protein rcd1 n=1 Tax=Solanum commersonii TaxID=4109 RepID=A0A9J5YBU8_SOLCO|nr:hypothetical protein H5410_038004 [Solanum commersonii]
MENLPESPFTESALISSPSLCNISSSHVDMQQNSHDLDGLTPNQLVLLLHGNNLRGEVMYQLIKEVISVYWKLSPPLISMKESTRACNALALLQVMAKNPETRKELIEAKIPCYFYPFLKSSGDDKPLEYLRLTSLGVLGALAKVATLIVMKILMQKKGTSYCCATPECFYSIVQVLYRVVQKITKKPCLLHLMMTIKRHGCCRCYISMFMDVYFPLNEDSVNYQECNAGHNNSGKEAF